MVGAPARSDLGLENLILARIAIAVKESRKQAHRGVYEGTWQSFSDMALLMLAIFVFLFALILITSRMSQEYEIPALRQKIEELTNQLKQSQSTNARLTDEIGDMASMSTEHQMDRVLASAGLADGQGRKDFEIFIQGLRSIPGKDIHMVVDATGSMHGLSSFLIPILRVIVIRSGKDLSALTWYANEKAETYQGPMGQVLDLLIKKAPFTGEDETIGDAFRKAVKNAPKPGAYLVIGDEPSTDRIYYHEIPSPVYTLPIGHDPDTLFEYQKLADETGGKMLRIEFR
jgi:cell division protein FtsL